MYGFKGCRWKALNQKRSDDAHRLEIPSSHSEAWNFFHLRCFLHWDIQWHDIGFAWFCMAFSKCEVPRKNQTSGISFLWSVSKYVFAGQTVQFQNLFKQRGLSFIARYYRANQALSASHILHILCMYKVPVEKYETSSYKQWLMRTSGVVKHL